MELREAECCYNCEHFLCEHYEAWGVCKIHTEFEGHSGGEISKKQIVDFTKICDDFSKNTTGGMKYCRNGKEV